jgi:hypothetical protein
MFRLWLVADHMLHTDMHLDVLHKPYVQDNAAMYTKYDQLNNNKGMGISDIGPFISDMSRVISLPARGRDRVYHSERSMVIVA